VAGIVGFSAMANGLCQNRRHWMRVRDKANREVRLGSYELFQRSEPLQAAVWDKMMRGLSTRNYGPVVKDFANAYGVIQQCDGFGGGFPGRRGWRDSFG
jgi:hypothetical protein